MSDTTEPMQEIVVQGTVEMSLDVDVQIPAGWDINGLTDEQWGYVKEQAELLLNWRNDAEPRDEIEWDDAYKDPPPLIPPAAFDNTK